MTIDFRALLLRRLLPATLLCAASISSYAADPDTSTDTSGKVDLGTIGTGTNTQTPLETVDVFATRGTAAAVAPTQANLDIIEPQSIISRAFIDSSVPPSGNFADIVTIVPSVSSAPSPSGPGVQDSNTGTILRGFNEDQYTLRFDGIPFGDTNDPSNHPSAYFPASMLGGVIVDRGPGNASDMGQSNFGGSINLLSRTSSDTSKVNVFSSFGSFGTWLLGATGDSGRLSNGSTLTFTYQHLSSEGYLSYEGIKQDAGSLKFSMPLTDSTSLTLFATEQRTFTPLPDSSGAPTYCQIFGGAECTGSGDVGKGLSYGLSNNPESQNYYGYNTVSKRTDFEYAHLQSDLGGGWTLDNRLYTYAYENITISGLDGTEQTPNTTTYGGNVPGVSEKTSVALGDVPGYNKLNQYRVLGDILRFAENIGPGQLRFGVWLEGATTNRHNYLEDLNTNAVVFPNIQTPGAPDLIAAKFIQGSGWKQWQPYLEYEWNVDGFTIIPGVKYMNFVRSVDAAVNQGSKEPANFSETFTATLPFIAINKRLTPTDSVYVQASKGMHVPELGDLEIPSPNGTNPSPETTNTYQAGFVHKSNQLTWDADIYYVTFNNIIEPTTLESGQGAFYDAGSAVYKGIEGEATYILGGGFALYGSAAKNDATYASNNQLGQYGDVLAVPAGTAAAGILYNQGGWTSSLIYKFTGGQYFGDNAAGYPNFHAGSYNQEDLNVAYTWNWSGRNLKSIQLKGSIYNLLNNRDITGIFPAGTSPNPQSDGYQFQPPRSFMITANAGL
jgi:iron complex outermembrane recepter protein